MQRPFDKGQTEQEAGMYLRSVWWFVAYLPLIFASCAHRGLQAIEKPTAAPVPEVKPVKSEVDRPNLEMLDVVCVLWNEALPRNQGLAALVREVENGKEWLIVLEDYPGTRYDELVGEIRTKGRPIDGKVLGHEGWVVVCQSDTRRHPLPAQVTDL